MRTLVTVFGIMFLLSACQASPSAKGQTSETAAIAEYHKLTPEEAFEMMSAQETTIVDVRTEAEYQEGHIENAILVPNESIGEVPPDALPDKEATLLVYCRSGRRSKEASEKLLALGYQNVYDFGGITDWPYDIVKGS